MLIRGRYQGDGIGLVDDKGRVAIPSALRTTLAANAPKADGKTGGTIIIGAHQKNRCLVAYDSGYLDILAERLDRREAENTSADGEYDYNIKRRAAVGEAVPFDGSGRFIMPAFPRFYAGIGEHAFFYGVLDYIEIWDPTTLIATEDMPVVVKEMARFYMQSKGIAL
ncbi:division/cell wall cluster transcriptional repressor MraZ [Sphingomonas sp. Leaf339]|uniref:division/cell wall cluster transcriptional repressor MraZ n=1 Tax=Sphingomonas sp. Leaf339 TaxID=1736343 RepID=UPI0012E3A930|nr:division/cell wall cluster transcriptional repressor MraZ [Sphingomonas sp. Leaf339]